MQSTSAKPSPDNLFPLSHFTSSAQEKHITPLDGLIDLLQNVVNTLTPLFMVIVPFVAEPATWARRPHRRLSPHCDRTLEKGWRHHSKHHQLYRAKCASWKGKHGETAWENGKRTQETVFSWWLSCVLRFVDRTYDAFHCHRFWYWERTAKAISNMKSMLGINTMADTYPDTPRLMYVIQVYQDFIKQITQGVSEVCSTSEMWRLTI